MGMSAGVGSNLDNTIVVFTTDTYFSNLKRGPFEWSVASVDGALLSYGGALASPSTAYIYDWNLLPIGQLLWLKELETYRDLPSLQVPASYNLSCSSWFKYRL